MRWRCTNKNRKDYPRYGGRGITVCARWTVYKNFAADMGPHPGKEWSLEREKNNQNYRRGNCVWATSTAQNRNRNLSTRSGKLTLVKVARIRQLVAAGGVRRRIAFKYGITPSMITYIIQRKTWK